MLFKRFMQRLGLLNVIIACKSWSSTSHHAFRIGTIFAPPRTRASIR